MSINKLTLEKKMNCYDLLEEVKREKNFRSDNELAKFLGITRQAIHGIKNGGGFNDEIALKVQEVTKRDLSEILLIREISRENNTKIKAAWENISKLSGIAASVAIACILSGYSEETAGFSKNTELPCYTLCEVLYR